MLDERARINEGDLAEIISYRGHLDFPQQMKAIARLGAIHDQVCRGRRKAASEIFSRKWCDQANDRVTMDK